MAIDDLATGEKRGTTPAGLLANPYVRQAQMIAGGIVIFVIFTKIFFPAPGAILFLGAVLGSLSALIAMGIVLVYRANRIINFAQGEIGAVAGLLGVLLVAGPRWNFWLAMSAGLAAALVVGGLVEFLFIRRFAKSPRLILMVATIGIAQLLSGVELIMPQWFGRDIAPQNFPTPFSFTWNWSPVIFRGDHILAIVVVVVAAVGLSAFFRLSRYGVATRASAESAERSLQLGIPVARIGTLVWVLAAGLSAASSLLRAPLVGVPIGQVLGPSLLLRALAAAVIGRMENLSVTFAAAVGLGVIEQSVYWSTGRSNLADPVLFLIIIVALLAQPRGTMSKADDTGASTWELVKEVRPIPAELRRTREVQGGIPFVYTAVLGALLVGPMIMRPSRVNLLAFGVILAIVGLSLVILTGWAGEISLGQMAFFGFGAATAAKLATLGWNFFLILFLAGLVGAVASIAIGLPALRIRGPFLAVTTFAFALATSSFFLNREFFGSLIVDERFSRPLLFGKYNLETEHAFYYFSLIVLGLVAMSLRSFRRSRIGRVLIASRDNTRAAQAYGVSVLRARMVAFAFSGFFAALAGALFAFHQHNLGRSAFAPLQSLRIFTMVVFGGLGSISGVILGAAYFVTIDYFLPWPAFKFLADGFGLLLVLLLFPGGLGQIIYAGRDWLLRRVAKRHNILVPSLVADRRLEEQEDPLRRAIDEGDVIHAAPEPGPEVTR